MSLASMAVGGGGFIDVGGVGRWGAAVLGGLLGWIGKSPLTLFLLLFRGPGGGVGGVAWPGVGGGVGPACDGGIFTAGRKQPTPWRG